MRYAGEWKMHHNPLKTELDGLNKSYNSAKSYNAGLGVISDIERQIQAKKSELAAAQKSNAKSSVSKSMDAAKKANASLGTIMGIQQSMGSTSSSSSGGNGNSSSSSSSSSSSGSGWSSGGSSSSSSSSTTSSTPVKHEITAAELALWERVKSGQAMLSERTYYEQTVAPYVDLDKIIFSKLSVPANTAGGRPNSAHEGTLPNKVQVYAYNASQKAGVDYYLVMGTILHESGADPNAGNVNAAYGYMQVTNSTWNSYTDPNYVPPWSNNSKGSEAAVNRHTELYNYVKEEYGVTMERTNSLANIAVGVAVYQDNISSIGIENMSDVVQQYGEGSKTNYEMMVSSSSEILYYRDILAQQKGQSTWCFDKLYTQSGKHLAPNYDPIEKRIYY